MIFFTADTHFGHSNILSYCKRPFQTIEEHDEVLVQNWNNIVKKKDIVFHLGDVGFGNNLQHTIHRLNGKIHLIIGNHDYRFLSRIRSRFTSIDETKTVTIQENGKTYVIFLSHFPHRSWDRAFYGTWHLFGHVHGRLPHLGYSFDVGVDCWNFAPVSLEQVVNKMKGIEIVGVD